MYQIINQQERCRDKERQYQAELADHESFKKTPYFKGVNGFGIAFQQTLAAIQNVDAVFYGSSVLYDMLELF